MTFKAKISVVAAVFLFWPEIFGCFFLSAPKDFPSGKTTVIEKGTGLAEISGRLEKEGLVRSQSGFALYARVSNKSKKIKYGKYLFNEPVSVFSLTSRLAKGRVRLQAGESCHTGRLDGKRNRRIIFGG